MTTTVLHPQDSASDRDQRVTSDLRVLARFIDIYCRGRHGDVLRSPVALPAYDIPQALGRSLDLCPECARLCTHAFVKRLNCQCDPKPQCKHCSVQCYHPEYQQQIREVMKYSGRKLVMRGRLDYLLHLLR